MSDETPAPVRERQRPPTTERYSPQPDPSELGQPPTLEQLEDVRQAAVLLLRPTDADGQAAMINMAAVLGFTIQGKSEKQIAELTGLSRGQVRLARKALKARDLLGDEVQRAVDRLTNDALPLAIDNVMEKLEAGNEKYTDRVLDTMGLAPAKPGTSTGGPTAAPMIPTLTLNFTLPAGVSVARANILPASGKVIGRGKDAPVRITAEEAELNAIELPPDPQNARPDGA